MFYYNVSIFKVFLASLLHFSCAALPDTHLVPKLRVMWLQDKSQGVAIE